jgi:sterol 22-desaturase
MLVDSSDRLKDVSTHPTLIEKSSSKDNSSSKKALLPTETFAWELNAISVAALVAVYAALPESLYSYFYGFLALITIDAARYYSFRGSTPGVPYTLPFVSLLSMLVRPVRFWHEQGQIALKGNQGMSTNTLVGKFMIFISDPKLCREVMLGEGTFQIYAHPNAKWLFGPGNLIYMPTEMHKSFRAILTPALFSNEALTMYAQAQEKICRQYLSKIARKCQETNKAVDVRVEFRSLAAAASQESFMGPYLNDKLRQQLEYDILEFTVGFLCFPFPYLGTGLAKAVQAKHRLLDTIITFLPPAREYVRAGNEPRCLLEHWAVAILAAAKAKGVGETEIPGCSDLDLAMTVMDFLFAAQDATNSALTAAADVLATRPDVVAKITQEVQQLDRPLYTMIRDSDQLVFTTKASKQLLHHKPPVPMIPHLALRDTTLGGRPIPKGAILIPSMINAAKASGSSDVFDPYLETLPDPEFVKTPLFGGGQHKCPGRRYAESLLTVFVSVLCTGYEFERVGPRPDVDDIMYYPTVFPGSNLFWIRAQEDEI